MADRTPTKNFPCDACRRRKVRCDYGRPCERCKGYNLVCTFDSVRKKRGPKKGRGAIVEQLRAESRNIGPSQPVSPTAAAANPTGREQNALHHREGHEGPELFSHNAAGTPGPLAILSPSVNTHTRSEFSNSSYAAPSAIQPGAAGADPYLQTSLMEPGYMNDDYLTFDEFAHIVLGSSSSNGPPPAQIDQSYATSSPAELQNLLSNVDSGTIPPTPTQKPSFELNSITERGIGLFFSHLYPIYPILDEHELRSKLQDTSELDASSVCMLLAICAMALVHVERWPNMSGEQRAVHARRYIRQCQEIRLNVNFIEEATFADILCSLFIAVTHFELKCRKASWFFVREAITLAHATGLHLAARDSSLSITERVRKQRAYALLFITERGAAVLDNFPLTILSPPELCDDTIPGEDPTVSRGLVSLHNLFSLLDFDFVHLWNDLASLSNADRGFPELSRLQTHLRQDLGMQGLSDIQRADVLVTQQWLRLVFWQAALRLGLISSSAADPAFTYYYPVEIAASLCEIVKSLPPVAIQVHGLGIFEKQFEIAYSLLDALTLSGAKQPADHYETLRYLLLSLSASPNSRQIYVRTLEKKMGGGPEGTSEQKYRHLAGVQLLRDDGSIRQPSRRASTAFA